MENSFELVKKLINTHIDDEFSLISLDVSLFTNIPIYLAIKSVTDGILSLPPAIFRRTNFLIQFGLY